MATVATNDLDYLAARLHARRSRMMESARLDAASRLRSIPELGRAVRPDVEFPTATSFQQWLLEELVREHSLCLRHLDGEAKKLIIWMQSRFQIENIKVLLRGFLNHGTFESLREHLVSLPPELALDAQILLKAGSTNEFARRLPAGLPRKHLEAAVEAHRDEPGPFFFEAALDGGYFSGLLARIGQLSSVENELIEPLARQQVEQFHLMLVVRGKFNHGFTPESLLSLRVSGFGAAGERFKAMLAANDISAVAKLGLGHAFDELPGTSVTAENATAMNSAVLESLAARHFLRMANGVFRRSHMRLAAIVGYLEIRRIEVANLITLSEGIRLGVAPDVIRPRLTRQNHPEVQHV